MRECHATGAARRASRDGVSDCDRVAQASGAFLYFAYGSNMGSRRLRAPDRAPSARRVAIGRVSGYRLTFDKVGRLDGSGKCDCEWTGRTAGAGADHVWGVVWRIAVAERAALDRVEGEGSGYRRARVVVQTDAGPMAADTYLATTKAPALEPFDWYLNHVLEGAIEAGLPAGWIDAIRSVGARVDPDGERARREWAIHAAP
ncbi:MAG: gamma-glutamylcyclotransferase family protein [Lautropia sp.]